MSTNIPDRYEPTPEEIKARKRRNVAIALVLVAFMVFVFMSIVVRAGGAS